MLLALISAALAGPIPEASAQLVLGWTTGWDSSAATLQRYTRTDGAWQAVGEPFPARLGREGLAWGLGLHAPPQDRRKIEGDWRAPAGVFAIGDALGDVLLSPATEWPMIQVTERTLWVEDSASELYNRRVVLPGERPLTAWESSQRMALGDDAHRLKLVIEHNTAEPVPGGSAIFFHSWRRDGQAPTAGCTAMPAEDLEALVRWLRPDAEPVYVLLPEPALERLRDDWGLPARRPAAQGSRSER